MVNAFEKRRQSQRQMINSMPLYPNEEVLWNENVIPSIAYDGQGALALPKLNLQFLTMHDYLLRNFNLFRLEATYEIREDLADVMKRMQPVERSGERCSRAVSTAGRAWRPRFLPRGVASRRGAESRTSEKTKPAGGDD